MKKNRNSYLNLKEKILEGIKKNGGWVNAHSHLDRAFTLNEQNFKYIYRTLQEKWSLNNEIKKQSSVSQIYDRMAYAVETMVKQGVTAIGTFIDVDEKVKDKSMKASERLRSSFKKTVSLTFINQVLDGVLSPSARQWFNEAVGFVDIIGGLPGKDKGKEKEHIDVLLSTAKKLNKRVHVHVDQLNSADERETELLAKQTIKYGMEGKVTAIHGISIGAHTKSYRDKLYSLMKKAKLSIVACPSAWIDSRRTEVLSPTHNAVTPIEELIPHGITTAIGTDNIVDIYKPFLDGDMWTELRFLLESTHFYEVDELIKIATINGRNVLGLT